MESNDNDYGIFPPPTDSQDALNELINHFLGKDWYSTSPMNQNQVNTEAIHIIMRQYPGQKQKQSLIDRLFDNTK